MYDRQLIESIHHDLWVMGNTEDLLFECHFMDFFKPKKVLELGAASGAWGLFLHYFGTGSVHFDFVENFEYTRRNFDQGQPWPWPSTKSELENYINSKAEEYNKPFSFNVIEMDAQNCLDLDITEYDIIRWDCDFRNYKNTIGSLVNIMKPTTVFFVDDTAVNKCSHRLITMMNLVNERVVRPLWFGNNQSAWVKPEFYRQAVFSYMKDRESNFLEYRTKSGWPHSENGSRWDHCSTSLHDFRKKFKQ